MRIWSIHPKYLDSKGLVALWRETLLAKHVLEGRTKGYRNHPQLVRFRNASSPTEAINNYLAEVWREATTRGYRFDGEKIDWNFSESRITVTSGQVEYETAHLLNKLMVRDIGRYNELVGDSSFDLHPLFVSVDGDIEPWEKLS
jgi:hypothetical protein